jgi:hypothetical protein
VMVVCLWRGMSRNRPFFALIEPMAGGRGSTAIGRPSTTVALARSIVTPSAPCMRRGMGGRTLCCATTAAALAGKCLWSSGVLLLFQDLLWCRAISISTGGTPVVRHPLQPLPRVTLRTGMQRGMVHREQVGRPRQCVIRGHGEYDPPPGTSGAARHLPYM